MTSASRVLPPWTPLLWAGVLSSGGPCSRGGNLTPGRPSSAVPPAGGRTQVLLLNGFSQGSQEASLRAVWDPGVTW